MIAGDWWFESGGGDLPGFLPYDRANPRSLLSLLSENVKLRRDAEDLKERKSNAIFRARRQIADTGSIGSFMIELREIWRKQICIFCIKKIRIAMFKSFIAYIEHLAYESGKVHKE